MQVFSHFNIRKCEKHHIFTSENVKKITFSHPKM